MLKTATEHDAQARQLVEMYDRRVRLTKQMANNPGPTGADADVVLSAGDDLDAACERFRRQFYPRRHRVSVGLWAVFTSSKTGASVHTVVDLFDEFANA